MVQKGDVLENLARRERVVVVETGEDNGGRRVVLAATQQPTTETMPRHFHPLQKETFAISAGALTYVLGSDAPRVARAGEVVTVEPGVPHVWWNDGPETVELIGTIEPAGRWLEFMETIYGLIADGKLAAGGRANPLQMALTAWEFRRDWVPAHVPAPVRILVMPVVAAIARALGYKPTYRRRLDHEPAVASL